MRKSLFRCEVLCRSVLLALLPALPALAQDEPDRGINGGINTGTVRSLFVSHSQGGFVIVESRGPQTGAPPGCAQPNRYAFSLAVSGGYAYLAVLQAAIARQQPVTLAGTGSCTVSGSREDLANIQLVTPSP